MKKIFLTGLAALLLGCTAANSQTYVTQVKPMGGKLWGYANQKGEILIQPQFEKCHEFSSNGLAPVYNKLEKQFYFINISGNKVNTEISGFKLKEGMVTDFKGFNDGLIQVKMGDLWGYMNSDGKLVIAAVYDEATHFSGGYAVVRKGKKFFILDTQGKETAVEGDIADVNYFREGRAIFRSGDKKTGFLGTDGKIAVQAQFESVGPFFAGLAWAKTEGGKVGYINPKGDWVIEPQYEAAKNFDAQSGLARVKKGEVWTYVNQSGKEVSITCSESLGDFFEGLADGKKGEKKGFYNNKGEWVIEPQFDGLRDFKNGFAAAKKGDKWGVIDKTGKWVAEPKFDAIKDMELVK